MGGVCAVGSQGSACVCSHGSLQELLLAPRATFKCLHDKKVRDMLIIFNHSIMYTENIPLPLINTYIYVSLLNLSHPMSYNCV